MIRVSLRGLAGRKLRTALTAIAIVLGVAMVSGSFVLTDTISRAFDTIFTSAYKDTDAVVSGKQLVDWSASGNATLDPALLERVRTVKGVEAAAGSIMDIAGDSTNARLIGRDGKTLGANGNPTFGFGIDPSQPRFNPLRLVEGRWATGPHAVVIDEETARSGHFTVGDTIRAAGNGPIRAFRVSGLARFGDVSTLGGATIAVWDVPTARSMLGIDGFTAISVAAVPGVSQEALAASLRKVVPATAQVRTAVAQAEADKQGIAEFVTFIRGFLLAFGGVALLVGAFVIFNSLSITVAQRTRELATLRTLGASRRQVLRAVLLESIAIGTTASVIGIVAGIGLARGLSALFGALGLTLPESSPVYATRTFVVSLLVGVGVTVLAGLMPALRATRVAPIAAVREGAVLAPRRRFATVAGTVLLIVAAALLAKAVLGGSIGSGSSLLALAGGALCLVLGTAAVASRLVAVLASLLGAPSRRLGGVAGRLAARNAVRNPSRTASTAAALMIGLTLVTFVAVLGAGVRDSYTNAVTGQLDADWAVTSQNGWSTFPAAAGTAAARAAGITAATSIRYDRGLVGKAQVNVNAIDPATLDGLYRFRWTNGSNASIAALAGDGAIVKQSFAREHGLHVGDRFTLGAGDGGTTRLRVVALYQPPRVGELLGGVVIGQDAFDSTFPRPQNQVTLLRGATTQAAIERALASFPDARAQTAAAYVESQVAFIGTILNLLYVLLALSVIVSLFGMVNTLVLSVIERTRELGMLRAVGMSRRQARRMIRHESVITALIGAGLGLPLGLLLGGAVTHALGRYGVELSLPVGPLVAFTLVAIVCGLLAAVAPARRAARLNVLEALQYE